MKPVKDRHPDAPGEANRDKHINFLAEEMGDVDSADGTVENNNGKKVADVDNGFFTNDKEVPIQNPVKKSISILIASEIIPVPTDEAQTINDSVPEGNNNNPPSRSNKAKVSKIKDDQVH